MIYKIGEQDKLEINTLILDLNGTLSVRGEIVKGVHKRLHDIQNLGIKAVMFTGNTRKDAPKIAAELGIDWELAKTGKAKADLARTMDPDTCASIGNGLIDLELTRLVKLGIVVTGQGEGYAVKTENAADIGILTINDALDLFLDEDTMNASLRP